MWVEHMEDGHWNGFRCLAVVSSAAVNNYVQIFV